MEKADKMNYGVYDQAQALRDKVYMERSAKKVITVTSGKGGVGKSTIAVNLAIALSQAGRKVLIVDADFGLANIDVMLGVSTKYNLSHLLQGKRTLSEIIQEGYEGVRFISGGSGVFDLLQMNNAQVQSVVGELMNLSTVADILIFDTGAGVNDNILQLIWSSTESIVVTTPEPTAVLDAYALVKTICKEGEAPPLGVIMNKAESRREAENATTGFQNIIRKYLDKDVVSLGYVPFDSEVSRSIKRQVPILVSSPHSQAARNMVSIAQNIVNHERKTDSPNPLARFFMRFLG